MSFQVIQRYGQQYLDKYQDRMSGDQVKALQAMMACGTGKLGSVVFDCTHCGHRETLPRSCGNRHCPRCQGQKNRNWLEKQLARQVNSHYFLMTFTVPKELRRIVRGNPRVAYAAMMNAAAEATKTLAADHRHLGTSRLGFFCVLHTWGRDAIYHPHVHIVVVGGGVSEDRSAWLSTPENFFLPEKPLAILYRNKLRDAFSEAKIGDQAAKETWERDWTVDVEPVGNGTQTLRYLSPYVFRVAIGNSRVQDCDWAADMIEAQVTLMVRPSGKRKYQPRRLSVEELLRRFLQHVLPSGFQKVRHHGFLNSHSKTSVEAVRWMIAIHRQELYVMACPEKIVIRQPTGNRCEQCGGDMICTMIVLPGTVIVVNTIDRRSVRDFRDSRSKVHRGIDST